MPVRLQRCRPNKSHPWLPMLWAFIIVALTSGCANRPQPYMPDDVKQQIGLGEHFITATPAGWQPVSMLEPLPGSVAQFIPEAQNPQSWQDLYAYQIQSNPGRLSLTRFVQRQRELLSQSCPQGEFLLDRAISANAYQAHLLMFSCFDQTEGKADRLRFMKIIQGHDNFYTASRHKALADGRFYMSQFSSSQEWLVWSKEMEAVSVCTTEDKRHECPLWYILEKARYKFRPIQLR